MIKNLSVSKVVKRLPDLNFFSKQWNKYSRDKDMNDKDFWNKLISESKLTNLLERNPEIKAEQWMMNL